MIPKREKDDDDRRCRNGPEMQYKENQGMFVSRVDEEPFSNNMSNCSFHFPFTVVGTSASSGTVVYRRRRSFFLSSSRQYYIISPLLSCTF